MSDAKTPLATDEVWSVCDFARRYRLPEPEEKRLLALFGPFARGYDLLVHARRYQLVS